VVLLRLVQLLTHHPQRDLVLLSACVLGKLLVEALDGEMVLVCFLFRLEQEMVEASVDEWDLVSIQQLR
jgi:hypothetical protein